jgi:lysophospholipase L1-like esterase
MKPCHTHLAILALSAFAGFAAHAAELESTTPVAAKTNSEAWWNGNCKRIDADIEKMRGRIDVAFVGDSITARWRGNETWEKHWGRYKAVNMGIGGDQTQHVLWRLQNGDLDGYKAKLFVVMVGTNNMWGRDADPAHAAAGVKAVIDLIQSKQPQARILLMSILPIGEKPNPGREKRAEVNKLISKFAGGSVEYMDIWDKYLNADGSISKEVMGDFLHLAPKGFDIWAEAIGGKVKELTGKASSGRKSRL